jgi:hypothetical protein
MTQERTQEISEEDVLLRAVTRLNANILGVVVGALFGAALLLATLFLVLKGGTHVGQHLALLGQYFYGYNVSVGGAFVGLVYGAVVGYLAGYAIGWVYNRVVALRGR